MSLNELEARLQQIWNEMSQDIIQNCVSGQSILDVLTMSAWPAYYEMESWGHKDGHVEETMYIKSVDAQCHPTVAKSSTSTQAHLLPSASSVVVTTSLESQPPFPLIDTDPATSSSNVPLLHYLHPHYQCFHLYQLKQVLFLKLPLYPIPYVLHPRLQNKLQNFVGKSVLAEVLFRK
ncbi:hypothetical protein TNCV_4360101 [Trichonephila clavipes]|uniref:Uncharacterized protein n=1 Tax=Trichonephila clavipes TaxID=2585209 RepID=A0A8X6W9Y8_TRICX|nr:hypothetical protein TNCV_4360101 [Trichonephila clavipes]